MKKLLAIVLVTLMLVTVFAGCGGGSTESGGSSAVESKWPSGYPFQENAFSGKTLSLWTGQTRTEASEYIYKEFEDATGAKVEVTIVPYGDGLAPYSTAIASGGKIDFFAPDNRQFPTWVVKNLIDPVSSVIDLKTDDVVQSTGYMTQITDFFTYKGEIYAFLPTTTLAPSYIIYRKSAFDEAGLDDPHELWKAGNWNFDTMKDLLAELTYDSDEDGIVDKFGITGYLDTYWVGSAGGDANYVRYDEEGRPQFAIDDPDIIECYEFYRELQVNQYYQVITTPVADFVNGDAAMYGGIPAWDSAFILEEIDVEDIGYVPFPASPSNASGKSNALIHSGAYAVPSSVQDRALLKEWIRYNLFWKRADAGDSDESFQAMLDKTYGGSKEWFDFSQSLLDNTWIANGDSFGLLGSLCNEHIFWKKEESIINCVTAIAPACQAEINAIFYDIEEDA